MLKFVLNRLLVVIPTLLALTLVAFLFVRTLPGDVATAILGPNATEESIQKLRGTLGLNNSPVQQYFDYLGGLFRLDLGTSAVSQQSISAELATRLPATIELALVAILVGAPLGVLLGRFAAQRVGTRWDTLASASAMVAVSVPVFVLGLALQYTFAAQLQWLPAIGRIGNIRGYDSVTGFVLLDAVLTGKPALFTDGLRHLILPALTLAAVPIAVTSRIARASYLAERDKAHVRVARAKGLSPSAVNRKHIARNSWPPLVIVIGLQVGALLSGGIITENIFGWGGIGSLIVSSIRTRDYVVIQSCLLVLAVIYVLANLIVDLVNARLDPRLRSL